MAHEEGKPGGKLHPTVIPDLHRYGWRLSLDGHLISPSPNVPNPFPILGGHGARRRQKEHDDYRARCCRPEQRQRSIAAAEKAVAEKRAAGWHYVTQINEVATLELVENGTNGHGHT